ncbi:tetratricopeptide repeat protein [Flammeovirga yaeyamensis]|uniref:Tetratricopeptide repeat protein n=1 Tax=Flammeovirga yaeyamensis TaxID=367791 RepID=A0AAX1N8F5_9BACT|nr:tetratricopeptide repeat protein [Flammeovirga yaeyamensis]MBB3698791.1 tetratricopeptide (TPR) repeat protein [Flammeovirga yaeyamensis]NMF37376.1 tetratricopeptide repeat protein [Flammeovirga yaeyamensis]QWG03808.1 tetratricopeptide repeat protein [Flammeovirga yaeyamensis]
MNQRLIIYLFFFAFTLNSTASLFAQGQLYYSEQERMFNKAKVLFSENNFSASRRLFKQFTNKYCGENEKCIEAEYYLALCQMELAHPDADKQIEFFVKKYPVHPFSKKAYKALGSHYFEKGEYAKALEAFNKDPFFDFYDDNDRKVAYQAAYANFDQGNYKEANKLFQVLKKGTHPYANKSSYYAGYLEYDNGDYETAATDLEKAVNDPEIRPYAYALLPLAYYKLGQEDEMLKMIAEARSNDIHLPSDAMLFAAKVYFKKNNFEKANLYFDEYLKDIPLFAVDRVTSYQIGYTKFKIDDPKDALPYLSNAADSKEKDKLAQLSAYNLGVVALSLGDKEKAMIGFEQASKLEFNKTIQEQSSYNYCKLLFDLELYSSVPRACDYFLAYFPNSGRYSEVENLMNVAFVNSGDYSRALKILDKKSYLTEAEQRAYQEAAFNKAVELGNDNNEEGEVKLLRKSQKYPFNDDLLQASNFFLGEGYSALNYFDTAAYYYKKIPQESEYYLKSRFGLAYVQYAEADYTSAIDNYSYYINNGRSSEPRSRITEAIVRRADCYFGTHKYEVADRSYAMAEGNNSEEQDYIAYQRAQIKRAKGMKTDAYREYKSIVSEYGSSAFAPLSAYHAANLLREGYKYNDAIKEYSIVIDKYPQSSVYISAIANRALVYSLLAQNDLAEKDYKYLIDKDPVSPEAENAIEALQEMDNDTYVVSELDHYKAIFKEANPESNATLIDDFNTAMKPYQEKDYARAVQTLNHFLVTTPSSKFSDDIYFSLGFSHKMLKNNQEAIKAFEKVEHMPEKEKSLRYVSDLHLEEKEYKAAIESYNELDKIATRRTTKWAVNVGLMKAHFEEKDYTASSAYANKIIDEKMSRYVLEARLFLSKIDFEKGNYNKALTSFDQLSKESSSEIGAQAQYYTGVCLRKVALIYQEGNQSIGTSESKKLIDQKFTTSTQALLGVQKKFAGYPIWTSKGYLLIAENYISIDDLFNAKATLESIQQYSVSQEDKISATKRLEEIKQIKLDKSTVAPTN